MLRQLYIGVMSGTSMDGIDAVLLEISTSGLKTLGAYSETIPHRLKQELQALCFPGDNEINRCGKLDVDFGERIASAVNTLLNQQKLNPSQVCAIGSHGQTIRHCPDFQPAFSWQIGNPSIIADRTGITTVADFRMADIAAGGQGAPLVPAFHHAAFQPLQGARNIINIGGIANITTLKADALEPVTGYDIGPGNTLLDQWIQKHQQKDFDQNGEWARTGQALPALLEALQTDQYIARKPPKSSGKEYFNLTWLQRYLDNEAPALPEDIQRTLVEFSAIEIANSVLDSDDQTRNEVFLCGGGVNNALLLERIRYLLPDHSIALTNDLGIEAQQVEAAAFAWLAHQTLAKLNGNIQQVTGATKAKILGGIYPA